MEEDIVYLEEVIDLAKTPNVHLVIKEKEIEAIENLIKGYRELEEKVKELNFYILAGANTENWISKSKIKEKIEEQLEEANDVLENGNYLDNFNGDKSEQKYYYEGYKDATIFISELMEDK